MAKDLTMKGKIELSYTDKNGNKVLATAAQVDKAVAKIGKDAAASQRGADAVTKSLVSSLKSMYNVSHKVASEMAGSFKSSLVQSMTAGKSLHIALAEAGAELQKTAEKAHYAERAFIGIDRLLPQLAATFAKASGAENLMKTAYEAKLAKEQLATIPPVANTVAANIDKVTTATKRLSSVNRATTQTEKQLREALQQIVSTLQSVDSRMSTLTGRTLVIGNVMRSLRGTLSGTWTAFYRLSAAIRRAYHVGKEWLDMSTAFAETNHLLMTTLIHSTGALTATKIAMEDVTDETRDLVVQLTDASDNPLDFGLLFENADIAGIVREATDALREFAYVSMLDPTSIRKTYASFMGMADASGIMGQRAVDMSQQMTQLAVSLSSLWDIDIEDAATKLRSALAGNTRAARALGLDMGRSAANAWLLKNGIEAEYNSLSLADRMTVQYALAMEGAAAAHDDLAKSALQPANMLRLLGEQAKKTARAFGNALFPVFTAFVPLIIVLVEALGKLAEALSAFFSRKIGKLYDDAKEQWVSYADSVRFAARITDDETANMVEDANDLGTSIGSAGKAAKDFKKQLLGFDEINNLTEKTTASGGLGGLGGLGDSVIPQGTLDRINAMSSDFGNVRIQIYKAADAIKRELAGSAFGDLFRFVRILPQEMQPTFKGLVLGITGAVVQTMNLLDALGKVPEKLQPLQKFLIKQGGQKNAFDILAGNPVDRKVSQIEAARAEVRSTGRRVTSELPLAYSREMSAVSPGLTIGEKGNLGLASAKATLEQGPTRSITTITKEVAAADEGAMKAASGFGKWALALTEMDGPLKTIFSGLGKIFGRLNPILDIITLVIETLKNSPLLRGTLTTILASVISVLTYLGGIIDSIFGILSPLFGLLGDIIAVSLQPLSIGLQLITFLLSALQGILQPIAEQMRGFTEQMQGVLTFPTTITGALESLGGTPTVIDSLLQNTATSVDTNLGEMSESVDSNMEVMKASMKGAFDGDTNGILEVLGTLLGNILTAIVNWISSVDWGEKVQQVATFLAENGPKILKAIATILGNIFTTIVNWILNDLIPNFPTYLAKVWDIINTVLGGWPEKLLKMGADFIVGFWNGIQQKIEWVKQKVKSAFDAVGNVVKKLFGIASPSKLMMEYGGFVTEGFEIGIEGGIPDVLETVGSLAANVTDIMNNGVVDVGALATAEMDSLNGTLSTGITATAQTTLDAQSNDLLAASQMEIGLLREQNSLLGQLLEKEFGVSLDGNMLAASINKASRVQGRPLVWA